MDLSFKRLLKAVSITYPLSLSEQWLNDTIQPIITALRNQGVLVKDQTNLTVTCPGCENACLETAVYLENSLLVNCPYRDDIGVVEIPREAVNQWRFSFDAFTRCLAQQLELRGEIEEAQKDTLWFLGKALFNGKLHNFYLSRTASLSQVQELSKKLASTPCIILWTGEKPHLENLPNNVFQLVDVVSINEDKFYLDSDALLALATAPVILSSDAEPFEFSQALQNGKLFVDFKNDYLQFDKGKRINLVHASPEYFFLMKVMQNIGKRVSHTDLETFIVAGIEQESSKPYKRSLTNQDFYLIKSDVKSLLSQAGLDRDIIQPKRLAYMMEPLG